MQTASGRAGHFSSASGRTNTIAPGLVHVNSVDAGCFVGEDMAPQHEAVGDLQGGRLAGLARGQGSWSAGCLCERATLHRIKENRVKQMVQGQVLDSKATAGQLFRKVSKAVGSHFIRQIEIDFRTLLQHMA